MKHSECRKDFLRRMEHNENLKKAAKETGERINFKRQVSAVTSWNEWGLGL